MAGSRIGRWALVLGVTLVISGCVEQGGRDSPRQSLQGATRMSEREVEAPEIFEANEDGLWDGRPSLGGIWVAHPDVTDPQRVLIVNQSNGQTVVGALFRRERENPGPRLQVSSDAAQALGILAGQPTSLRVIALKREEVAEPAPAEAAPAADAALSETTPEAAPADTASAETGAETGAETAAAAVAAIEATGAEAAPAAAAEGLEPPPVVAVPEDRPPTSFGRRQPAAAATGTGPVETPAGTGAEATPLAAGAEAAPVAEPQPVPEDRPPTSFGRRRPAPPPEAPSEPLAAGGDITVAPLDGAAPEAAAAPEAPAAADQPDEPLSRPFVQAAIFGTEANAETAAEALRAAGLTAEVRAATEGGTTFWRVLVGPAGSVAERDAMLETVRGLGYGDAYAVRG
jgi:hypothetical protein